MPVLFWMWMMWTSHVGECIMWKTSGSWVAPGTWLCPHSPQEGLSSFLWTGWVVFRMSFCVSWLAVQHQVLPALPFYEALPFKPQPGGRWSGCLPLDWGRTSTAGGLKLSLFVDFMLFTINKIHHELTEILFACYVTIGLVGVQVFDFGVEVFFFLLSGRGYTKFRNKYTIILISRSGSYPNFTYCWHQTELCTYNYDSLWQPTWIVLCHSCWRARIEPKSRSDWQLPGNMTRQPHRCPHVLIEFIHLGSQQRQ